MSKYLDSNSVPLMYSKIEEGFAKKSDIILSTAAQTKLKNLVPNDNSNYSFVSSLSSNQTNTTATQATLRYSLASTAGGGPSRQ